MDMDGQASGHGDQGFQFVWRNRPQAVRRNADVRTGQFRDCGSTGSKQGFELRHAVDKAALPFMRGQGAEPCMGIKHREQRQANASFRTRCGNACRVFCDVVIGAAIRVVVQIMKFANACESLFQHFHIKLGGNCFNVVGRHFESEFIHQFAPAPETVGPGPPGFCKACHGALEGVGMEIGHARENRPVHFICGMLFCLNLNFDNPAICPRHANVFGPTVGQQCGSGVNVLH